MDLFHLVYIFSVRMLLSKYTPHALTLNTYSQSKRVQPLFIFCQVQVQVSAVQFGSWAFSVAPAEATPQAN